ncbi:hypothetical protein DL95DRAFT_505100, partial [Leptodontidium sp. 2 PMI_412]
LRDNKKRKWVLILDNVDDAGFLKARKSGQDGDIGGIEGGNSQPLVSYLPQCSHESILITSRSEEAALQLVRHDDIIKVDLIKKREALELFRRKIGPEVDDDGTDDLVRELELIPLAITQASVYVPELMSLMSFFDRQGIPDTLLRHRNEQRDSAQGPKHNNEGSCASYDTAHNDHDEDDVSQSSVDEKFEDGVSILRQFSFISANQDGTTFEMHGLVQLATRKWLEARGQTERWKHQFIKNFNAELPTGEYENWERC